MKRIDERDLFKPIGDALVTKELRSKITASDIATFADDISLKPSDLIVHTYRLDWGNGEQYPLDDMVFFESEKPEVACTLHLNKNETT